LSGSASLADYQTAIEAITFNNTSDNPDTTPRTVTVVVNDGLNSSNTATTTITVNAADDDAPVLDLDANDSSGAIGANFNTAFTEGGGAISIGDTDVLITDIDDTNIESATITLTNAQIGDVMAAGAMPAGITAIVAGNVVTLSGSASLADYQTAIEAITFNNTNAGPDTTPRIVTVVVNDGTNDSNTATTTIMIDTIGNDAPILDLDANDSSGATGADYQTTFAELGGAISIGDIDVSITDVDDTNIEGATITLTNGQIGDVMAAGAMPAGITAVVVGNIVTLSGSASLADYQTAIEAITFNNPNDNPDTTPRTITVVVNDGTVDSNTATTTITVNVTPIIVDAAANVSEEGLPGAVSDTTGVPTDTTNAATVSGTMSISDASGIASVSVSGPGGLTSGGVAVTWSGSFAGGVYTLNGSAGATPVATLTLDTAGAYTFTLLAPLDHPLSDVEDILALGFTVTATDIHSNVSTPGTLTINVEDDMPLAADPTTFIMETQPDTAEGSFVVSFGADGGYVSQISYDGNTYTYDISLDTVTESGGSTLVESWSFNADNDELTINTTLGETFVVDMHTGEYSYAALAADEQVGPVVNVNPSASLLGIANAEALGLIDIGTNQMLTAVDANNDIEEVIVRADSLISIGLGNYYNLTWSAEMAAEFGLNVVETNDIVNLILITTQSFSQLTITSIDGGPIDNLRLNEFLATVYVDQTGLDLLSLGLLPEMSITATDSLANSATDTEQDVLGLSLLDPASSPANIIEGDGGANGLNGGIEDDRIYGYGGNDVLNGGEGNDLLRGGAGNDVLIGAAGNDIIIGGKDNDTLSGGSGNDTFIWEEDDEGIAGTPATDTITDFNASPVAGGGDIINLSGLLIGELARGNTVGNLTDYMHFVLSGGDTILYISTTGGFSGGFAMGAVDQQITFTGVDLIGDSATDEEVIAQLLANGNLIVDQETTATDQLDGITTFGATITDNDDDTTNTTASFDTSDPAAPIPGNVAPVVQDEATALLGLVGLNLLDLIDLESQAFAAADENGNLRSVVVEYVGVIDVSLEDPVFTASQKLAAELGLTFTVVSTPGTLVVGPTSTITITALDGGNIDNQAVNELLATVRLESTADLLGLFPTLDVTLLGTFDITATDSEGLTDTESVTTLANANVLEGLLGDEGNPDIIEGTSANDTLNSSVAGTSDERLYGHEGDDTINGGDGNDLIRGGAGNDTLNGGDGNDILIDGNGADTFDGGTGDDWIVISDTSSFVSINGGTGTDTLFLFGSGMTLDLNVISGTTVTSIEKIDLTGTGNNALVLSYSDLLALSESSDILYVTGDDGDMVTLAAETLVGTGVIVDGVTYNTYNIGGTVAADIWVQQGITVL
jgi:T1SS-143 domain-containing protein